VLRTFIKVTALLLVFISSFFLIKGVVALSSKDIAELSQVRFDYHSGIVKNLTRQKSDTVVGFSLLLLSLVLQLLHLLLPYGIDDLGINRKGVILALVASILILIVAYKLACCLQQKWYAQAENILKTPKVEQKE
jgi:hypothetical protein